MNRFIALSQVKMICPHSPVFFSLTGLKGEEQNYRRSDGQELIQFINFTFYT
jgi:hypothetical protein